MEDLSRDAVNLYLGEETTENILEQGDENLANRMWRFVQFTVRVSTERGRGLALVKANMIEDAGLSEEQASAILEPIRENLETLRQLHHINKVRHLEDSVAEMEETVNELSLQIERLTRHLE